jgi:mannobiose 2-epimerase
VTDPALWKDQGLNVLSAWTTSARDTTHGAFHSHLDRHWQRFDGTDKYPGMIARHIFSYSAAYLLSGAPDHLRQAEALVDFLIEHGWDEQYGGWYNSVSREGAVTDSTKDLFMQIYAATGLTLYYTTTRSDRALRYVEATNRMLENHAWDETHEGYVSALNRDLTVKDAHKDFTPQGATLSGHLLYLYQATRNPAYLDQMKRVIDVMRGPMRAPGPPWIYERFAADWQFLPDSRKNSSLNVGHNIELAWLLLRLHALTGTDAYNNEALRLSDALRDRALAPSGAWVTNLMRPNLEPSTESSWWMQAYGNMFALALHESTAAASALEDFRRGAAFWNRAFIDSTYGGAVLKTTLQGDITRGEKAVRSKTSYHTLEHALLNYLYLGLGPADEPVTLHFRVDNPEPGETLHPLPIAVEATIDRVTINGIPWTDTSAEPPAVHLPARDGPLRIQVTLR